MTFKQMCGRISCKTEADWKELITENCDRTRSWVQAHGELAACLGFVAGILMVIFYQIFAWLFFIGAVTAAVIWLRIPESGKTCCRHDPE